MRVRVSSHFFSHLYQTMRTPDSMHRVSPPLLLTSLLNVTESVLRLGPGHYTPLSLPCSSFSLGVAFSHRVRPGLSLSTGHVRLKWIWIRWAQVRKDERVRGWYCKSAMEHLQNVVGFVPSTARVPRSLRSWQTRRVWAPPLKVTLEGLAL